MNGKMKTYGATIIIKIPMTFRAENKEKAKKRVEEVGRWTLNDRYQASSLIKITATDLQEIITF